MKRLIDWFKRFWRRDDPRFPLLGRGTEGEYVIDLLKKEEPNK